MITSINPPEASGGNGWEINPDDFFSLMLIFFIGVVALILAIAFTD